MILLSSLFCTVWFGRYSFSSNGEMKYPVTVFCTLISCSGFPAVFVISWFSPCQSCLELFSPWVPLLSCINNTCFPLSVFGCCYIPFPLVCIFCLCFLYHQVSVICWSSQFWICLLGSRSLFGMNSFQFSKPRNVCFWILLKSVMNLGPLASIRSLDLGATLYCRSWLCAGNFVFRHCNIL